MRHPGSLRKFPIALLALALAAPLPVRAQAPFFIPVPASILTLPLLLLLVPLGMQMSKSDEKRVRELEGRGDWAGVVALASHHLSAHPGDLDWHELRARVLQRQGRCVDAIADYRVVFDGRMAMPVVPVGSAFAAGLALGLCEMAVWDLPAAAQTMTRLARLEPARWEPDYNLGVIRALQGDLEGARAAQAVLVTKEPAMAQALQSRYIAAAASGGLPVQSQPATPAVPGPALPGAPEGPAAPTPLLDARLVVGNRELVLPPGAWYLGLSSRSTVVGGHIRVAPVKTDVVTVETVSAFALAGEGRLGAAAVFSANPKQAYGISYWNVEEPCDARSVREALLVERFKSPFDQPECLIVRVVNPATALASLALRPALQSAQAAGASLPPVAYEIHYVRYGLDWVVAADWLLPVQRVAGELAAIQWALSMADGLRPLARQPEPQVVTIQPLGPMH